MTEQHKPTPAKTVPSKPETPKKTAEPKAEAKKLPPLDFTQIKVRSAVKEDLIAHRRTKGTRDPEQVAADNLVRQAYDKWVEAGKPTDWLSSAGFHIRLPEGQYETFEKRVRSAGQHFALAVRFGERRDSDGYAEVVLVVKDRPKNAKDEGKNDETASGE